MVQIAHKPVGLLLHNGHRRRNFPLPAAPVGGAGRGEVIDGIEPYPRPIANPRIEVAGHGQIEHHQRPTAAIGLHHGIEFRSHNRCRGPGRADHQIGRRQFSRQRLKPAGPCPQLRGQRGGAFGGAVHNHHIARPRLPQVAERLGRHLAGTDEQHPFVVKALKNPAGEIGHSDTGNREPLATDRGFTGHPFGGAEGRLEHLSGERAGRLILLGERPGLLDLRHNLRLTEHHAVEACGNAEEMPRSGAIRFP